MKTSKPKEYRINVVRDRLRIEVGVWRLLLWFICIFGSVIAVLEVFGYWRRVIVGARPGPTEYLLGFGVSLVAFLIGVGVYFVIVIRPVMRDGIEEEFKQQAETDGKGDV